MNLLENDARTPKFKAYHLLPVRQIAHHSTTPSPYFMASCHEDRQGSTKCRERDSNPHVKNLTRDFKSLVSAIPPSRHQVGAYCNTYVVVKC